MDCGRYRLMISKELDGELNPSEEAELREHLSVCPDCMRFYRLVNGVDLVYQKMPDVEPPPHLLPSIIAATTGGERVEAGWPRWLKVAAVAASAAIAVLGANIGWKLADLYMPRGIESVAVEETFGLDYLSDTPPGSVGYALLSSSGGDGSE